MRSDITAEVGADALRRFAMRCRKHAEFDAARLCVVAWEQMRRHDGLVYRDEHVAEMVELEQRWFDSLDHGTPDYGVYGDPFYFVDVWVCWTKYSRKYLQAMARDPHAAQALRDAKTIVDLGCGFGYTTAGLKQIAPRATVYGTNLPQTAQWRMASDLGAERGFEVVEGLNGIEADVVFASEYFEHHRRPIEHLEAVIDACKPKHLLAASTFTQPAIGHFNAYRHGSVDYTGRQIAAWFAVTLRERGYEQVRTSMWNQRPALWRQR